MAAAERSVRTIFSEALDWIDRSLPGTRGEGREGALFTTRANPAKLVRGGRRMQPRPGTFAGIGLALNGVATAVLVPVLLGWLR